ncbi:MAG: TonB-dependent receptor [Bacteroidales bacterium]
MKQVCILLALVCFSWQAHAQFSVKGTVTGHDQEPLIGAHVMITNTYYQTITDNKGSFNFNGMKSGSYEVKVSYVGYETWLSKVEVATDVALEIELKESPVVGDAVVVSAVRASQNTPTTFSTMNKEEISRKNTVQDLPYLLNMEPSVVATSDAGAGIGYTGLRIRGSDITRINVTINGIPLNDPESHAVYWVDIPDFASSVNSLQLQRGVGSSTNGAGAFGASMNLETNSIQSKPYGLVSLGAGSFNTWKTTFQGGTGLIRDHWYFEGRASALGSDGYIDRASSDLSSYFIQGGYYNEKTLIKAIAFGGKEKTYQAWYGIDGETMKTDRTFNYAGAIYDENWNVTGYYDDQTDNYTQNHYQLHISQRLAQNLNLNLSGHLTTGNGYYEEYQQNEPFADYGLNNLYFGLDSVPNGGSYSYFYHDSVTNTDLVRRRWLDNKYYGLTWSLHYKPGKADIIIGGAYNKFDKAKHYGEIIWAEFASVPNDHQYYENMSFKTDFNAFAKTAWSPIEALTLYADLQYRTITYKCNGIESHLDTVAIQETFHFFNPKLGLSYSIRPGTVYISYSIAHREPIRDDYIDALAGEKPKPEMLGNLEAGIRKAGHNYQYAVNYYLMNYRDQLVLTGAINDDGQYVRKNAGKSYRTGVELSGGYKPAKMLEVEGNLSLSVNKTDYTQEDEEGQLATYTNSTLSFSPGITGSSQVRFFPFKQFEIDWMLKYVSKQYLDNTQNEELVLDSYLVNNLRLAYLITGKNAPDMELTLTINNLLNEKYESNGAVYGNTPYYYPQAGIHFMAGLNVKF